MCRAPRKLAEWPAAVKNPRILARATAKKLVGLGEPPAAGGWGSLSEVSIHPRTPTPRPSPGQALAPPRVMSKTCLRHKGEGNAARLRRAGVSSAAGRGSRWPTIRWPGRALPRIARARRKSGSASSYRSNSARPCAGAQGLFPDGERPGRVLNSVRVRFRVSNGHFVLNQCFTVFDPLQTKRPTTAQEV